MKYKTRSVDYTGCPEYIKKLLQEGKQIRCFVAARCTECYGYIIGHRGDSAIIHYDDNTIFAEKYKFIEIIIDENNTGKLHYIKDIIKIIIENKLSLNSHGDLVYDNGNVLMFKKEYDMLINLHGCYVKNSLIHEIFFDKLENE